MKSKKLIGIILAVLFLLLLYYTSPLINNNFDGALGYLRLLAQLRFRKRDDRDLRRGKECVDENKYDQYQNFRQ